MTCAFEKKGRKSKMIFLEIVMIVIGLGAIIYSTKITDGAESSDIKSVVDGQDQMEQLRHKIEQFNEEITRKQEEKLEDTSEKMNTISNEKIMGISEYSDQVIDKIEKNHAEAALPGGGGDGEGILRGGRGSLAAANRGHLDIIDQNRAAAGVAVLGLIAERKLHAGRLELSRDLNRYIGRLIRRGYNGFRQLGNNACGVPDGVPGGAAVGAGFQCKGGTASAQRFLNLIDPVCAELERHVCGLAG